MQKKDDKVRNKTTNKDGKKRERERKLEIGSPRKSKFWLLHMREKQKNYLITSD